MKTRGFKAALFDMDGTLVDSTAVVERVWSEFADEHHLDFGEIIAYAHGRQTADSVAHFLPNLDESERESIVRRLEEREVSDVAGIRQIPHAARVVAEMQAIGIPVAIVTSAGRALAAARLQAAGIPDVAVLVCAEDIKKGKPSPEGYLEAARQLGVDPKLSIIFEDAPAGIEAATRAGSTVVVVGGAPVPQSEHLRIADYQLVTTFNGRSGFLISGLTP